MEQKLNLREGIYMDQKTRRYRRRHAWMPVLATFMLLGGILCMLLLWMGLHYFMPAKSAGLARVHTAAGLNRDEHIWIPPTEPPTEEEGEAATEPLEYDMTIDLNNVIAHHNANSDVVGWVRISGTVINYPIMQCDDNSFYVNHSWQGYLSSAGAIFADCRCRIDASDNTLIYGHNMGNGTMLHAIKNYKVAEWGWSHPYIEVASLSHRYLYRVLSTNVIYGERGAAFEYWNFIDLNRGSYRNFVSSIRSTSSVWYGGDDPQLRDGENKIFTLQTCNSGRDDGIRCVVFAECIGDFTNASHYDPKTYGSARIAAPEPPTEPPAVIPAE